MESYSPPEWLNYHHLRYFYTVAKEGSLRGAAEKLKISQSSICAQIQLLESALGEDLFRLSARSLVLTEFGHLILGYAEEIFRLGRELLNARKQFPGVRALRLNVGIVDSFPKLTSFEILRPAFTHDPPIHVTCHEGKLDDLLVQLATHRVDVVLADEPASPGLQLKTFNHPLGSSGITFCAAPSLARTLKGRFPRNLNGAPALLGTQNTSLRRGLEKWFRSEGIEPRIVGEFEDGALAKIVATEGIGFIHVPTSSAREAVERYGFTILGRTTKCEIQFYAITAERRVDHPAVRAITENTRK
ncbi:MAG: LysR family transcriptional regulator [Verrucomicrobiales bacterium]|jgi:LysR family transcriptional activator of nhaA|nr:LysR family transcriptional regulator [Verrucomicrobiales bacterium]